LTSLCIQSLGLRHRMMLNARIKRPMRLLVSDVCKCVNKVQQWSNCSFKQNKLPNINLRCLSFTWPKILQSATSIPAMFIPVNT
jgi:hypothetical protein